MTAKNTKVSEQVTEEVTVTNQPAADETTVAETTTKEETTMTNTTLTAEQEQLVKALMVTGVTREMAITQMKAIAAMSVEAPQEAVVTEEPAQETPAVEVVEEAPVVEAKKEEEAVEKKETKSWFKAAVAKMNILSKNNLMSELIMLKVETKDPEVKKEIELEIEKLKGEEGDARFDKMKGFISTSKGWAVDASGKVADALYVAGDYTEKGATGLTKMTGKATKMVGEQIVKAGQFIEDNAETVGKAARMPMDLAGDTINLVNGTKQFPKSSKSTK